MSLLIAKGYSRSGCEVVGRDDTAQGARYTRRDRLARWQGKEYRQWGARQQDRPQRREEEDRRGGKEREGGRVRRGYTPEPVYGQKCESPRLTSGTGAGGNLSQKVAICSVFLRYSHMLTCIHATQQPDLLDMPKFLQSTRVIDMMVCSKQVHCFSTLRLATQYFLQGVNLW